MINISRETLNKMNSALESKGIFFEGQNVEREEESSIEEKEVVEEATETLAQRNVVNMAKSYLDYTSFSRSGLVEQLEFEGFSNEDANYAVDEIGF